MAKTSKADLITAIERLRQSGAPELSTLNYKSLLALSRAEERKGLCHECGQKMSVIPWNSKVDMIVCLNGKCRKSNMPVGSLPARRPSAWKGGRVIDEAQG